MPFFDHGPQTLTSSVTAVRPLLRQCLNFAHVQEIFLVQDSYDRSATKRARILVRSATAKPQSNTRA